MKLNKRAIKSRIRRLGILIKKIEHAGTSAANSKLRYGETA